MGIDEIKDLENYIKTCKESQIVEFKCAESNLPASFWETYSSFCNTEGGIIILGVVEGDTENQIIGVNNPDKIVSDMWNSLSNPQKVSLNVLKDSDVRVIDISGSKIIIIEINEVDDQRKPVYLKNKLDETYIRTGDGDRKATKEELLALSRNARPDHDSMSVSYYSLEDIDMVSLVSFKEIVSIRYPQMNYTILNPTEFLRAIGGMTTNRKTDEDELLHGTILFFGKYNSIKELYPHYHLDYFNRRGLNVRWTDRLASDEPQLQEMNLYNFYNVVMEKLRALLQESFNLKEDDMITTKANFDLAVREALVNCLAHADYSNSTQSIKITAYNGWFHFENPGKLLISKEKFFTGGKSLPRNEVIFKLFRLIGASERQGFGGPQIFQIAINNEYRRPEINTDLDHTELKVWNIDLTESYPELSVEEKEVFKFIVKKVRVSMSELKENLTLTETQIRNSLSSLVEQEKVIVFGKARATKYALNLSHSEAITHLEMILDSLKNKSHY